MMSIVKHLLDYHFASGMKLSRDAKSLSQPCMIEVADVKVDCPSLRAEGERGAPQVLDVSPLRMFDGRAVQTRSE